MGWLTLARLVKLANAKLVACTLTVGGQLKGKKETSVFKVQTPWHSPIVGNPIRNDWTDSQHTGCPTDSQHTG